MLQQAKQAAYVTRLVSSAKAPLEVNIQSSNSFQERGTVDRLGRIHKVTEGGEKEGGGAADAGGVPFPGPSVVRFAIDHLAYRRGYFGVLPELAGLGARSDLGVALSLEDPLDGGSAVLVLNFSNLNSDCYEGLRRRRRNYALLNLLWGLRT